MKKTIWALFDDRVGSVNQAKGIIQALGDEYDVTYKHITYNRWASLPNCLLGASKAGISKDCPVDLSQPYPDIILSVSRRTTPIARYLKRKSQGKSKIVQLMYPGNCGIKELDLIIASQHDAAKCKNGNIFLITGCPHRITPKELELTAEKWKEAFTGLPAPRTAVIIGGAIKGKPFSEEKDRRFTADNHFAQNRQHGRSPYKRTGERHSGLYVLVGGRKRKSADGFSGFERPDCGYRRLGFDVQRSLRNRKTGFGLLRTQLADAQTLPLCQFTVRGRVCHCSGGRKSFSLYAAEQT